MDLGGLDAYSIKNAKWLPIQIKDQDFVNSAPTGSGFLTSQNEIIVFGGSRRTSFYLNV
jgi:hypothetical protein